MRIAETSAERTALDRHYQAAIRDSAARGATPAVNDFEKAIADSKAVISRSQGELQRLATSDHELYTTYYKLIEAEVRLPKGDNWDKLRAVADSALFPNYKEQIRFAALALDGKGLFNYGECAIVLRTDYIAHRASVFEENSVMFMKHHKISMWKSDKLPLGYRATWDERGKLCVAKLYKSIDAGTRPDEYSTLLLRQGATSEDDQFVEAHIYGPMTIRTVEQVILDPRLKRRQRATILKALKEKLSQAGVPIS
ncbi:MAG TPA: hypothetical protein VJ464_25690 [Blastocatellia bacterium]|nr:hypothetical protein [Blastocatellia bacterium]